MAKIEPGAVALKTFDGKDNRKEVMILLERLGSDMGRARFLESLIPISLHMTGVPMTVQGNCDAVAAYFMMVGICNELGVNINDAARLLEQEVKAPPYRPSRLPYEPNRVHGVQ